MTLHRFTLFVLIALAISSVASSQSGSIQVGPEKGHLLVVGGGRLDDALFEKFIELAGGTEARIVCIPTAGEGDDYDQNSASAGRLKALGAKNVTVLHTRDRQTADSKEFTEPLKDAGGVWFSGGRQWRLVDAYKDTRTEKMFRKVLDRGGVIGGSSAGATIQGSYLVRGDTRNNQIMMGDHEEGFAYLENTAIDQHTLARNRHFDMFDILKNRPELLGLSIDENTAILVSGNQFEVLGQSYVLVFDGTFWSREGWDLKTLPSENRLFYFLRKGDKYDLAGRKIIEQE